MEINGRKQERVKNIAYITIQISWVKLTDVLRDNCDLLLLLDFWKMQMDTQKCVD